MYRRRSPVFDLFAVGVSAELREDVLRGQQEENLRLLLSAVAHDLVRGWGGESFSLPLTLRLELLEDNGSYQFQASILSE